MKLTHLLIPKKFRVWCRPNASPGALSVTTNVAKTTCASCLGAMRFHTKGIKGSFRTSHTNRESE
jgi:hypothetical protein